MFTNEIRPYECQAYHSDKSCYALLITHMCVLDIESRGFHGLECRFNLPAFLIGPNSYLRTVEAYEDLQFRYSFGILDPAAGKIHILPFMDEELVEKLLLSDLEVIEEPPCTHFLSGRWLDYPEILPDSDIVTYSDGIEPSKPFLSDKFPVSDKTINALGSEKTDKTFHNFLALFPVGIPAFWQETENQWESYTLVGDAEHKDIDIEFTELPIGTVHAQYQPRLDRKQRKYHPGYYIEIQGILGKEPLQASKIGIPVYSRGHGGRKLMETDGLHHAEGMEKERHKFYSCQIHGFSTMLLHNREDLVNFDQVLGISSFHGEKSANFSFKLLIFRDFCKYNHLKFRCLTA